MGRNKNVVTFAEYSGLIFFKLRLHVCKALLVLLFSQLGLLGFTKLFV